MKKLRKNNDCAWALKIDSFVWNFEMILVMVHPPTCIIYVSLICQLDYMWAWFVRQSYYCDCYHCCVRSVQIRSFFQKVIYIYHLLKCSFSYINRKNYHPTPQKWSLSEPVFSSYKHPETRSTSNFIVVWKQWLNWKEHLGNSKCFV